MSCSDPSASVTEVGLTLVLYLVINGGWWFEQINRHRERKRAEEARYHSNIEIVTCMCPPVSTDTAHWAVHMKSEWKERARERERSLTSAQPPSPLYPLSERWGGGGLTKMEHTVTHLSSQQGEDRTRFGYWTVIVYIYWPSDVFETADGLWHITTDPRLTLAIQTAGRGEQI